MRITPLRRPAALAGTALIASTLPLLAVAGAAQADTAVAKSFDYVCAVAVSQNGQPPLNLQGQATTVGVNFTVPDLTAGATVPTTPVDISLTLPEALRSITVSLGGKTVSGSSEDTRLEVQAGDSSKTYPISGLSVTDSPIPQGAGEKWTIPITGASPEIPVPSVDSLSLLAPARFTVQSTISGPSSGPLTADLDCAAPADRKLADIAVDNGGGGEEKATPTIAASVTPDPLQAGATGAKIAVNTDSSTQATGDVTVLTEDGREIGKGTLDSAGDVTIALPVFGKAGSRTLTVKYPGDENNNAVSQTTTFTVSPRANTKLTPEMIAPVRTNPVYANRTRALLAVRTDSDPQATGTATVKTEDGRTIATGTLNSTGDVPITLPFFGKRGVRTLTVTYNGDDLHNAKTVKTTFRVR